MAVPKSNKANKDVYRIKVDKDSGRVAIEQWMGGEEYKVQDVDFVGKLSSFKVGSFEYKNKLKYKIQFQLITPSGADFIELGFNHLAKNLVNYFFNITPGANVELSFYSKDGHAKCAVKVEGEKGQWHWDIEQVKKANSFEDAKWLELAKKLEEKYIGFVPKDDLDEMVLRATDLETPKAEPDPVSINDDDLPF